VEVYVLNDYEFTFLAPKSVLEDPGTVFIISSYSGHSKEPLRAYQAIGDHHDRTMLLTSGGPLAEAGERDSTSIASRKSQLTASVVFATHRLQTSRLAGTMVSPPGATLPLGRVAPAK
jgi:DNA-binding MurR/RpiR family transcriptional regulator